MKKLKTSATVQIIGGIVLLVLLVVKQIVPMEFPKVKDTTSIPR